MDQVGQQVPHDHWRTVLLLSLLLLRSPVQPPEGRHWSAGPSPTPRALEGTVRASRPPNYPQKSSLMINQGDGRRPAWADAQSPASARRRAGPSTHPQSLLLAGSRRGRRGARAAVQPSAPQQHRLAAHPRHGWRPTSPFAGAPDPSRCCCCARRCADGCGGGRHRRRCLLLLLLLCLPRLWQRCVRLRHTQRAGRRGHVNAPSLPERSATGWHVHACLPVKSTGSSSSRWCSVSSKECSTRLAVLAKSSNWASET